MSKKYNKIKSAKPKTALSQMDELSYSYDESTPNFSLMSNTLSKSNIVNKESNKIMKGAGSVSKKIIRKNMQNPSQNQVRQMNFLLQMENIWCPKHQTMVMIMIQMRRIKMET